MKLTIKRIALRDTYTIGNLYIDGVKFCDTLEDAVRFCPGDTLADIKQKKIPGKTAIPAGKYKVVITMSNRFGKRMPELLNVPGYAGVRIHSGNTHVDTDGCILVGRNTVVGRVTNSRTTYNALMSKLEPACRAGTVTLEYI